MQRLNELTERELVALTQEELDRFVDYECALAGVPLLPKAPGPKPVSQLPPADLKVYEVGGMLTLDSDHAARILEAMTSAPMFRETYKGSDYNTKYAKSISQDDEYYMPSVKPRMIYSEGLYDTLASRIAEHKSQHNAWSKVNDEYSKALKAREATRDACYELVNDAKARVQYKEALREHFAKYLSLAEGNRGIALNFLQKTYDLSDFPDLLAEFTAEGE